jgi:hypothetical protein
VVFQKFVSAIIPLALYVTPDSPVLVAQNMSAALEAAATRPDAVLVMEEALPPMKKGDPRRLRKKELWEQQQRDAHRKAMEEQQLAAQASADSEDEDADAIKKLLSPYIKRPRTTTPRPLSTSSAPPSSDS